MKHIQTFESFNTINEAAQIKKGDFVRYKKDEEFTGGKVLNISSGKAEISNWDGSTIELPVADLEYIESWNESRVIKSDPMNEGVLIIAAGVILGLMGLKLLKVITKKVLGTIGINVKIEPDKLKSILSKIVKETMSEAGGMLGSDFIQITIIERQIASKIDNGEITTIGGIMAEFESLTKD